MIGLGSGAAYIVDTVDTVFTVDTDYTVDMVYTVDTVYTVMWLFGNMGYVVDEAEWADRADRADVAEMALCMNALFYFDCLGHKEFKNIAYNGLWESFAVPWSDGCMDGRTYHTP